MKRSSLRSGKGGARARTSERSRFLRSGQPGSEQVAAVCYRMRGDGIEFLLVQSRGGRWIFPKGSIETGLTRAQSAALEAFEEAGVHGRIEETSFARYVRRERGGRRASGKVTDGGILVHAHLCEVRGLDRPQESNRNRTWFTAEKAKRRLQEDRAEEFGADLARVVDRALSRIRRLRSPAGNAPEPMRRDALRKVCFEAFEDGHLRGALKDAALARYFLRRRRDSPSSTAIEAGAPEEMRRPVLRLGAGAGSATEPAHNITAIDGGRRASLLKPSNVASTKRKISGRPAGTHTDRSAN